MPIIRPKQKPSRSLTQFLQSANLYDLPQLVQPLTMIILIGRQSPIRRNHLIKYIHQPNNLQMIAIPPLPEVLTLRHSPNLPQRQLRQLSYHLLDKHNEITYVTVV